MSRVANRGQGADGSVGNGRVSDRRIYTSREILYGWCDAPEDKLASVTYADQAIAE